MATPYTLKDKATHKQTQALPPAPAAPLKGRGSVRHPFPFKLHSHRAKAIWNSIPEAHKCKAADKCKGKGNYVWRRYVSQEIYDALFGPRLPKKPA